MSGSDAIFLAFVILLAWAPFWLGGNRPLAWMINSIGWSVLLLAYEGMLSVGRRSYPIPLSRMAFPVAAFCVMVIWGLVQSIPGVPAFMQNPIWGAAGEALRTPVAGAVSIDPDTTKLALLTLLPPIAAFWLALHLCRDGRRAHLLVLAVAGITGLYALYAIVAYYFFPTKLLWMERLYYLYWATSTFVNRNNYATYAGIGLIASVSALFSLFSANSYIGINWKQRVTLLLTRQALLPVALLAALAANGIALMLSGSRAGIASTFFGLVCWYFLQMLRSGFRIVLIVALFILSLAILSVLLSFDDILRLRLQGEGVVDEIRWSLFRLSLQAITDQPWLGFGYGTFQDAFRIYRDASLWGAGVIDKAHNTYIEAALGLGLPVFLVVMAAAGMLVWRCVHGALTRRQDAEVPMLAAAVCALVGAHALVDFSLQMQGLAVTFAAILGAGVSQSWSRSEPGGARPNDARRSR